MKTILILFLILTINSYTGRCQQPRLYLTDVVNISLPKRTIKRNVDEINKKQYTFLRFMLNDKSDIKEIDGNTWKFIVYRYVDSKRKTSYLEDKKDFYESELKILNLPPAQYDFRKVNNYKALIMTRPFQKKMVCYVFCINKTLDKELEISAEFPEADEKKVKGTLDTVLSSITFK